MLSGQLAINQGDQRSGPLIARNKRTTRKVETEEEEVVVVERPSEREEAQGASQPSHASFTLYSSIEIDREIQRPPSVRIVILLLA